LFGSDWSIKKKKKGIVCGGRILNIVYRSDRSTSERAPQSPRGCRGDGGTGGLSEQEALGREVAERETRGFAIRRGKKKVNCR